MQRATEFRIRRATGTDHDVRVLREALADAASWRGTARLPVEDVLSDPRVAVYVEGWPRPGDAGVIAEDEHQRPLGAAWYRSFAAREARGYGFVDPETAELAVAVVADSAAAESAPRS